MQQKFAQPALIGGLVVGVLSALPVVSAGNLCCCLWVVSGGAVAAYVLQQNQTAPITAGDGALVGLLAGLFGAVVHAVVSIPIDLMFGPMERMFIQRALEMGGTMPPQMRDVLEQYGRGPGFAALWIAGRVFAFMIGLCVGAVFSTIGGVIGAAIFKKSAPPGSVEVLPPA